ncbi:unnamed protein product [Somion occarium]|uniref:Diacylglycerol O-acyltransferase n=1 Tax=Somion occarium TaxID=3059160 RepID=A0ABP1CSP0_9APHY
MSSSPPDRGIPTPSVDLAYIDDDENAVEEKLQSSLSDLERTGGAPGWLASKLLSAGDWVEREVEERRQMIGGIDNLWLLLREATSDFNPVCACTYVLRGKISVEMLQHAMIRTDKKFPKYHQRLTSVGRKFHGARFEDDPNFDMNNHILMAQLPEPAGRRELDDFMGKFIAQDWDFTRPLWEMIILENYHDEDGGECAIVSRGHHTLADGQGFVISQLYMTSYHDELRKAMNNGAHTLYAAKRGNLLPSKVHPILRPLDPYTDPSNVLIAPLIQIFLASLFWIVYALSLPVSFFFSVYQAVIQITMFLLTCWRVEMLTAPQHGQRVHEREYSSSKVVDLNDIRLCQDAFSGLYPGSAVEKDKGGQDKVRHVTLNDVMCSVMVDVLAAEIISKPQDNSISGRMKKVLTKFLPSPIGFFIVRKPGDWSLRNLTTGSIVYLNPMPPDASISPKMLYDHIHQCRSALSLLKHSLIPRIVFYIMQVTGQVPTLWPVPFGLLNSSKNFVRKWVLVPLIESSLRSFPVILTNVPGPAKNTITLEGVEVMRWAALPPQSGTGTIGMGIISYAGGLCISVAADKVPASEGVARRICERFERRFDYYVRCAKEVVEHRD